MAMERIEIPPTPPEPVVIGEINTDKMLGLKRVTIRGPRNIEWKAYVAKVCNGSLLFVPGVHPDSL